ncbi:glycoside hydrolase family 13 protein [candidate division KSB1 bacterium]|nr:glycoside hydrolase family 13 protein [candidate division KSB1 bacterium]
MSETASVPHWAKQAVWYQIFAERFRNGDPSNDPTRADIRGAYPHDTTSAWQIHPWTSDWYELQPYERANGRDLEFNQQRRRYGGDLQGIIDKLDYLRDLGVNALYLTPVFESPSAHKYDGATYHHIDPNFGPDPMGDRKIIASEAGHDPSTWQWTAADKLALRLIDEVHRRDMRIIFDGVFNHVGRNHWAFRDVAQRQQLSPYKDWFKIKSWNDPKTGKGFDYEGWWSFKDLPEWRQDESGLVAGPREYVFAITRRWMDPNGDGDPRDGIDGWRLDVAECVHHNFWKQWRALVRSLNPEAYLTGEVINTLPILASYLQGDEFDAVMNYSFTYACTDFFVNEKRRVVASEFDRHLRELREAFPGEVAYVMQNLVDSHDTDRIASRIVNRDRENMREWLKYYQWSKVVHTPDYDTRKPNEAERNAQKLIALFQMTYLGAPMIYYGDEAGMWGANDPCCRKPMLWEDLHYAHEAAAPAGGQREVAERVAVDRELFEYYRKLIHIRRDHSALQLGDFQTVLVDDDRELYAFSRTYESQKLVVLINNSTQDQLVKNLKTGEGEYVDLLDGFSVSANGKDEVACEIEAQAGRILLRR